MKLYTYFPLVRRYRVRIALNLKNVAHEMAAVHLTKDGVPRRSLSGPQPQWGAEPGAVRGDALIQSLAIIEYLDEVYPDRRC